MPEIIKYPRKNSINNILNNERIMGCGERSYFLKFLTQDFSPNTLKALKSDLGHFLLWYIGSNAEPFIFNRFKDSDVLNYKLKCQQLGHAPSTINRRLTHLRMLGAFFLKEGRIPKNMAKDVKSLPVQRLAPKRLEPSGLKKMLKEAEIRENIRDQLILSMLAGAGFRVSELAALRMQDVDITDRKGHVTVRYGKGGKTREVPLKQEIRLLFNKYIAEHQPTDKVFLGQRGALTVFAFTKIVEFYAKKAGIKCHPHQLRHTFSYNYLAYTQNDLVGLAQILGHSNLSTTAIYTQNRLEDLQGKVEGIVY